MKKNLVLFIIFVLAGSCSFAQWQLVNPLPTANILTSTFFTDVNTGYAVGPRGPKALGHCTQLVGREQLGHERAPSIPSKVAGVVDLL